jgi:hypothetical protein
LFISSPCMGWAPPNLIFVPLFIFALHMGWALPNSIPIHFFCVVNTWTWSFSMCTNFLQTCRAKLQKLKGIWTSLAQTSWSSFSIAKGVYNLMFGSHILMSLYRLGDQWGRAKSKHIVVVNIFVKTFAFVIMDQTTWNCFLVLLYFLINSFIMNDIGCCLL